MPLLFEFAGCSLKLIRITNRITIVWVQYPLSLSHSNLEAEQANQVTWHPLPSFSLERESGLIIIVTQIPKSKYVIYPDLSEEAHILCDFSKYQRYGDLQTRTLQQPTKASFHFQNHLRRRDWPYPSQHPPQRRCRVG